MGCPGGLAPAHVGQWLSWLVPGFVFERQDLRYGLLPECALDRKTPRQAGAKVLKGMRAGARKLSDPSFPASHY